MARARVRITWIAAILIATAPGSLFGFTGADSFKAKCAMCHGADGAGATPLGLRMKVRDLRSPEVQKQTTESITAIVTNGRKAMPAFGKSLDAEKLQEVVAFVRSLAAK